MMHLVGEVKNKDAIIIDDMIDTAVFIIILYIIEKRELYHMLLTN